MRLPSLTVAVNDSFPLKLPNAEKLTDEPSKDALTLDPPDILGWKLL